MNTSDFFFHRFLLSTIPGVSTDFPWPKPFCKNPGNIKAIVLGCDPSNKHTHAMPYVFGLNSQHKEAPKFFRGIEENLHQIGLDRDCVYIQNLCRNYFTADSSNNRVWKQAAEVWIPRLEQELKYFPENIPVLLTSELLYKVLLNTGEKRQKAADLYSNPGLAQVKPEQNRLGRVLYPLYRHQNYKLSLDTWEQYRYIVKNAVTMDVNLL